MTGSDVRPEALEGFGRAAQAYSSGRPDYPRELLGWLRESIGLRRGKTAIDLGAGTGKFTSLLVQTEAEVIAVEPVDAMRAELVRRMPAICAAAGTAQAMGLGQGVADALLCAQSFHWFANESALAEMHRALKPDGRLGLIWNVRDESVDWVAAITEIILPYEGDAPRYSKGQWRRVFDGHLFSPPVETRFEYRHVGSPQQVILDRFLSVSFIAALPAPEQGKVAERLRELMASHKQLAGRERIAFPYQTHAYHCLRN